MKTITIEDFARRCGGQVVNADPQKLVTGYSLDNRSVSMGDIFVAIKGARTDGHLYVQEACKAGAVAALVERPVEGPHILVTNLVQALADFASSIRVGFNGPVVGITGSNGKTSTKEFTSVALGPYGSILKSIGNKNTEYTVPFMWASLEDEHKAVVAELAMQGFGQIKHLTSFTRPVIGVVTMIGTAAAEFVGSREGIAKAKSELLESLPSDGTAIVWEEDDYRDFLKKKAPCKVRTFGFSEYAECRVLGYRAVDLVKSQVRFKIHGHSYEVELPIIGRHQAVNAAAALLVADTLGVDLHRAAEGLSQATFPPNRMQVVRTDRATILMDAYNASPDSTTAAIHILAEMPSSGRKYAVLADMVELGDLSESAHRKVGKVLAETHLASVVLYGEKIRFTLDEAIRSGYPVAHIKHVTDIKHICEFLDGLKEGDLVLVKGSRSMALERILELLTVCS